MAEDEARAREPGQKTRRPRDELGQLLPWDAENRLHLEDFDSLTLEENHRLGREHFNAGRFFPAHEAWETAWKQARGTDDEEFYKGLSQLGAGYTHYRRGNPHGTHTLMQRGISRIQRYGPWHGGIDVAALVEVVEGQATEVERAERAGQDMPPIEPPAIRAA